MAITYPTIKYNYFQYEDLLKYRSFTYVVVVCLRRRECVSGANHGSPAPTRCRRSEAHVVCVRMGSTRMTRTHTDGNEPGADVVRTRLAWLLAPVQVRELLDGAVVIGPTGHCSCSPT